jgi:lipid II:glycine glycyltransferase (peptidoglycan interpeptide bridge formation enzyme)
VKWTAIGAKEAAQCWDRDLASLPERSLVQSFGWGDYKATQGWRPLRWVAQDERGRSVAMVQTLVRVYPCQTVIVWCPGGIVGPIELWNRELFEQIATATRASRLYCRAAFTRCSTDGDIGYLRSRGWVQPPQIISAALTMVWDIQADEDRQMAELRPNWRRNLHRAFKRNLRVVRWVDPSPSTLARLFEGMTSYKKIDSHFDAPALAALLQSLQGRVVMFGCEDESGLPLAVRACAVDDECAWDLLAATSPEGRRCYAAYAVFWELIRHCRAIDVKTYDLSGVDPVAARGVYDFKRGTGAREQRSLGEWAWATSAALARAVNWAVRFRRPATLS